MNCVALGIDSASDNIETIDRVKGCRSKISHVPITRHADPHCSSPDEKYHRGLGEGELDKWGFGVTLLSDC